MYKQFLKTKGKGMLGAMAIAAMLAASPVAVFAGEFTEDGATAVPISATIASSYTVSLPASFTLNRFTDEQIATFYPDADEDVIALQKNSYNAFGGIGVKGNFPSTKAVVVVAYDGQVDGSGNLTSEAIATGSSKFDAVNSEFIADHYDQSTGKNTNVGTFTLKKASNSATQTSCEFNGETHDNKLTQDAVRWASPALNSANLIGEANQLGFRTGEMQAKTDEFTTCGVTLSAVITDADDYSGYVGFTYGLTDRT